MRNRIRTLREEHGWTQTELGDRVEVTRQAILSIEKDKHDPSITLASKIARALGYPIDKVFDLDDVD